MESTSKQREPSRRHYQEVTLRHNRVFVCLLVWKEKETSSRLLISRKLHVKIIMRYHPPPLTMVIHKNTTDSKCRGGTGESGALTHLLREISTGDSEDTAEQGASFSERELPQYPCFSAPGPCRWRTGHPVRHLHSSVHHTSINHGPRLHAHRESIFRDG